MIQLILCELYVIKSFYCVIKELVPKDSTAHRQASTLMRFKLVGEKFVSARPFTLRASKLGLHHD